MRLSERVSSEGEVAAHYEALMRRKMVTLSDPVEAVLVACGNADSLFPRWRWRSP